MIGRSPREKVAKGAVSMFVHFRNFNHATRCLPSMGKFNVLSCVPQFALVTLVFLELYVGLAVVAPHLCSDVD